jgi:hypothetical protein
LTCRGNESYVIARPKARAGAHVAISFVSAENAAAAPIERLIKMSIEVDNAHVPFRSAERASGRAVPTLPRPLGRARKDRGVSAATVGMTPLGSARTDRDRRQPDFGRGHLRLFPWDRPPRFERPPREDHPPRDEDRPPRDRRREEPPRRPSERGPDGGASKWYQSFIRNPHESDGGERPERHGDDRDGERPPRRDEIAGDEHARKPFHKKGGFGKPFNKGGFGKPHSGGSRTRARRSPQKVAEAAASNEAFVPPPLGEMTFTDG